MEGEQNENGRRKEGNRMKMEGERKENGRRMKGE